MNLREIQKEIKHWSFHNFGNHPSWHPLLGIGEEVGELNHHYLKRLQGIRNNEYHNEEIADAVGDIMIFLMDFCNCQEIDLLDTVQKVWKEVKQRDWKSNKESG